MKRIFLAAGLAGIMFTSCDTNSSKDDYTVMDSSVIPAPTAKAVIAPDSQNQAMPIAIDQPVQINPQQQVVPASKTVPNVPAVTQVQTATTAPTAAGMNPPHGQPGHRCDIYVGAPLNSKPNPQPVVTRQPVTPVTAPGMNPPHGQPNHRCDIAVGAPLNSAPPPAKKDTGS